MANEKRLIDANALLEKSWDVDCRCGYVQVVDVGDIKDAPTVDAVEVVRCENCYKRNRVSCKMAHPHDMKDDDFCRFGERSE